MGGSSRVTVIIPWAADNPCPYRRAARDWVLARWRAIGHQVVVGETAGPWCKAAAVAQALPRATGDVLVIADADCWTDGIGAAVEEVRAGAAWAMPHTLVHRLSPEATADVLAGAEVGGPVVRRPYRGFPGGGIVVLGRGTYEAVPLDARFEGWGGEDESWALALNRLAGPCRRGRASLWHLWHPPQERMSRRWGSEQARTLAGRYRAASASPQTMRALLAESPARP